MVWIKTIYTTVFLLMPLFASATVQFEGYFKVISGGLPVGYVIQHYGYESKTKIFTSIYYITTSSLGGSITESLVAKANEKFVPQSYQYRVLIQDKGKTQIKTIDAQFKSNIMTAVISNNDKPGQTITKELPKGTFLSTFLGYMLLAQGLKVADKKIVYNAIAEEDASVQKGEVWVKSNEKMKGLDVFKIYNRFKNVQFISYVTPKAEVLATKSPTQAISTELVPRPILATQNFKLNQKALEILFGRIPAGIKNPLNKSAPTMAHPKSTPESK